MTRSSKPCSSTRRADDQRAVVARQRGRPRAAAGRAREQRLAPQPQDLALDRAQRAATPSGRPASCDGPGAGGDDDLAGARACSPRATDDARPARRRRTRGAAAQRPAGRAAGRGRSARGQRAAGRPGGRRRADPAAHARGERGLELAALAARAATHAAARAARGRRAGGAGPRRRPPSSASLERAARPVAGVDPGELGELVGERRIGVAAAGGRGRAAAARRTRPRRRPRACPRRRGTRREPGSAAVEHEHAEAALGQAPAERRGRSRRAPTIATSTVFALVSRRSLRWA